ncbi:histidine phosphatase family protein [Flavobacteriaceae bacterium TP-CH-4]|uniref:Histidine phosphatase family protein n=1 Tax=Pelagihabitans pacificus TaxID=2696054 RepID=A0A967ASY0_9FLAO|nr:histidine phosphatase family protein [Pelagihabitans pacificus]NHF59789.1 histidine phosphatase family protein [Pelagihabitans pacificus]
MKELILIRHGKSSWDYNVSDKDRPLKERGIADALLVSQEWANQGKGIDWVFSSPANRALHTCMIFLRQLHLPFDRLRITDRLYDFSGDEVLQLLRELDEDLTTVMIFGHNHAFTYIANLLGNTYIDNVPTSGLVHIQFGADSWAKIEKGTTVQTIFPKHIR